MGKKERRNCDRRGAENVSKDILNEGELITSNLQSPDS
jgi:hypothetical protein